MKKLLFLCFITFLVIMCSSCKKNYYNPDNQPPEETPAKTSIKEISLNFGEAALDIGKLINLIPVIIPVEADEMPVKFISSKPQIASVSKRGQVLAKKPGTAIITVSSAEDDKVAAKCTVTVKPLRKALITGIIPPVSEPDAGYTISVSFENCSNPFVKVIADCKGGTLKGREDTVTFDNSPFQHQIFGNAVLDFTVSGNKEVNSIRLLCFDNGELVDTREFNILLDKKE